MSTRNFLRSGVASHRELDCNKTNSVFDVIPNSISVASRSQAILITSFFTLGPALLAAQFEPHWEPLNEPGNLGRVEAVAVNPFNPDVILAGGDVLGVGLSTNAGVTWEQTLGITECSEINDFTFHPTDPSRVWVGTLSGPYLSIDGGKTWALKRKGMPPMSKTSLTAPIQKVLFDPHAPNILLALAGNHRHMGYGTAGTTCWGAVWKSTDGGENWAKLTTIADAAVGGPADGTGVLLNDAGFAAGSSSIVYACSDQGGVYKSTNGGHSFDQVNTGLPNTEAWALALHPTDPNTLWVSLAAGGGVYKSTNGGKSWQPSSTGMTDVGKSSECRTIAIAHSDPNYLYCALWNRAASAYRSTNGGATWTRIVTNASKGTLVGGTGNQSGLHFQWMSVAPHNPKHVLGACEGNVVQSFDAGSTWKDITCFAVGSNWRGNGYSGLCCTALAWNPYKPGQVFTLGMDGGKLLRSDDSLWSWNLADARLIGPYNGANDVTFAADGTIYIGSGQFGNTSGTYRNEPIIKSTNWGVTWAYISRPAAATGDNKAVYVSPADSNRVWALMGNELYHSTDGGGTWSALSLTNSGNLWNIAADPKTPNTLYVGARNGVFKTTDGTKFSLMPGSPASSNFEYVYLDPVTHGRLYALSFNSGSMGGVYRYDGTWTRLFKKPLARALAIDPGNPQRMAFVTKWWPARDLNQSDGVWLTTDGGNTWMPFNTGLRMLRGSTIAFNPDKSAQLILGTDCAGFYVTDLGTSSPYNGRSPALPGLLQAEDYDLGGEGIACHCATTNSEPDRDTYRTDSGHVRSGGSGHVLHGLSAGDWLKYQVNVTAPGDYDLTFRAASSGGGTFHLEANGVNVTGPVAIERTGDMDHWSDIVARKVRLTAGLQYLKLSVEAPGADLDFVRFARSR
jgi:photosystem II stability/assembly factor-like uncharacterized protein